MNKRFIEDAYPLSPMQSGLLFQSLYEPDSDAYFVQSIFEFEGEVNVSVLRTAWKKVGETHPILRTGFVWEGLEVPLQYVIESAEVPFKFKDWRGLARVKQEQQLEDFIQEDRKKEFDLSEAPLFRLTLIQCTESKYYFIWSQHHILTDGWCWPIILGNVFKAYKDIREGKEISLKSPRPYRDYIAWLQKQDLHKAETFWKEYLGFLEGPTRLSFKTIIQENKEKDYDAYTLSLSNKETEDLKNFAQRHDLTLNTVIQGAMGIVLKTYTQQSEVMMGVTVSGRSIDLPGVEEMVGLFINTLPLRICPNPTEDTVAFLKELQQQTQKLNDYAYAPLAQIQSWSNFNQSLFDVIFIFENYPIEEEVNKAAADFTIIEAKGIERTEYPLTIAVEPGKQLHLIFNYQTEHFNEESIKKFSNHIRHVLHEIFHHSKEAPQTLSLLTSEEEHQLLHEWNDTKVAYPEDKTIHQLFEEQVTKSPHNVAVVYEDQELTYQQLNERANQLAHHLRSLGVGPDTLVAIAVERSLEMIIGLLGILKAGGAYVPLDPSYPQERLQFMLTDTQVSVLITQAHLRENFKEYPGKTLSLQVNAEAKDFFIEEYSSNTDKPESERWINPSPHSSENPTPLSAPHHLAYVIYTSGSTGKPKGVMVSHEALVNRIDWTRIHYPISEEDSLLYIASVGFDISVWEMLFPLFAGASVVIASDNQNKDIHSISHLISTHNVTVLHFVPSLLNLFIRSEEASQCKSLTQIITGGEVLSNELRQEFIHTFKNTDLFLAYGPTEAAISVTHWNCRTNGYQNKTPIGQPIANTQIYILNSQMNPVPVGVSGEIYIGGVGLARGYLNRPDLTAERFIPNPFVNENVEAENYNLSKIAERKVSGLNEIFSADIPEMDSSRNDNATSKGGSSSHPSCFNPETHTLRLYRTGDLARYLPDGNIEFLGRMDDQVKIRGFRIELGEIESTLHSHEDVAQVVVMAREDEPNNKKPVAYLVPSEGRLASLAVESTFSSSSGISFSVLNGEDLPALTEDLRNHLAYSLPDYMIPSFFVYIDKIPLTPNGKIDRKALPAPDLTMRQVGDEYVAPQSQIEQELASIWAEVLKVEKIGVHDNFFRIGGDSIVSIQMVSKARSKGIHFAVKDVFNHPTVSGLASVSKTQESSLTFKPDQGAIVGVVPLTPIQHFFFEQNLHNKNHYNQATLLQASKKLDSSLLNQVFSFLLSHHDALRLRYHQDEEGRWTQTSLAEAEPFSLQQIDLSHIVSGDQLSLTIEELASLAQQSLDIKKGPLLKVVLFDCGSSRPQRLLIVIHHLAVDGVSWRILLEDLETAYTQLSQGKTPSLPFKTHSYQQWANALKSYASSPSLQEEIPYWKQIRESVCPLPVDFNYGPPTGESSRTIAISLTENETTQLLHHVPKAYRTEINDILLTALVLAIGDWTKTYALTLSLEGHGREEIIKDIDLSRTIGWFTSLFPVHLNINNHNDLAEAIKTVKEDLRKIPHKGIGYGVLSYLSNDKESFLSSSPAVDPSIASTSISHSLHPTLSFNYLGQWDNTLTPTGVFTFAQESSGQSVSDKNAPSHLLDINSEVRQGILQLFWTYSSNHYKEQTIEWLAHTFIERLKQIIQHCSQEENFGYTTSDFDLIDLYQIEDELKTIYAGIR